MNSTPTPTPDVQLYDDLLKTCLAAIRDCVPVGIAIQALDAVRAQLADAQPIVEAALDSTRRPT